MAGEVRRTVRRRSITSTQRRVVRRIVESSDGKEETVEDEVMLPVEAIGYRVVRRRIVRADKTEEVVHTQSIRRVTSKKEVEPVVTEEVEPEPEIPEPELDCEVEALPEPEQEEIEEDFRLRRVVRRPVHMTSRRTVIRKFEAATDEHDVEEEEEDGLEAVYPKRVV
eukprot:gene11787-2118_t